MVHGVCVCACVRVCVQYGLGISSIFSLIFFFPVSLCMFIPVRVSAVVSSFASLL